MSAEHPFSKPRWMLRNRLGRRRKICTQAVTAFKDALEVRTKEELPQQWATTQNNLGNALRDQGTRTGGEEGATLLAQAVRVQMLLSYCRTSS